jgi:hypothetical protein
LTDQKTSLKWHIIYKSNIKPTLYPVWYSIEERDFNLVDSLLFNVHIFVQTFLYLIYSTSYNFDVENDDLFATPKYSILKIRFRE